MARILSDESHRSFSGHLAKSALLRQVLQDLNALMMRRSTMADKTGVSELGVAEVVDRSLIWMDAPCAELDIHDPTDWLLLRDATRTIMKAIATIRSHGLQYRLPAPERLIAQMNAQCMAMSGASRRGRGGDKKQARKATARDHLWVLARLDPVATPVAQAGSFSSRSRGRR